MTDTKDAPTSAQTQRTLQQALDFLNRNDLGQAEAALARVLAFYPGEADALQLLGLIRRAQRRDMEAEALYRQSLAARPGQAHVHHNLGNLLATQGRFEEAAAEQREALRQRSNYPEAHLNLGHALSALGRHDEAERAYRNALRMQPNYVFAKQSLAALFIEQGKAKEAETLLRQTLQPGISNPRQRAALELNLAVAMRMQRRYGETLTLLDSAQSAVPEIPHADYNRALVLDRLNRLDEAADSYRRAIARNPLDLNAHRDLNLLLYRLERDEEFLRSFDEVMPLYPQEGLVPQLKAEFLMRAERYDEAAETYRRAAALLPQSVTPRDGLAITLARQGQYDEAIREHETVLKMEPDNAHGWRNFADTLLRAGDAKKALEAVEESLAIEPLEQYGLGLWGLALRALNDSREETLNDYETFVQSFEIAMPDGYGDIESFNRDLNAYLDRLHGGRRGFLDQTLRGGTQTIDNVFDAGHAPIDALRARIDEAVAAYIARLAENPRHPLLKRRAREFGYAGSWSTRLADCGFHTNHVHNKGWISSAYYVSVPDSVADETQKQGWLKFGEPNFDAHIKDPVRRSIKPVTGRLVLFPSYMWHGTVPFHAPTARTAIAFDVIPK